VDCSRDQGDGHRCCRGSVAWVWFEGPHTSPGHHGVWRGGVGCHGR
jgi:hypothetical protein